MAKVTEDYFDGSARIAETVLGWNRYSVQLGLHERRTGIVCVDNFKGRGRHNSVEILPNLESDIRSLVDVQAQADPKFQSPFLYARISARAIRESLINKIGYEDSELPSRQTLGEILNRLGYRLKKHKYQDIDEWVIDLDGGAATRSNRTQFIKRMVEISCAINLRIRLIYYPPYHSKYNPIERCWAALENYWNGAILDSVEAAIHWASNMTWKGIAPIVHWVETTYEKGIKLLSQELKQYQPFWQRSETLPKWDITIAPV